jgi:hypothetical protein
MLVNFHVAYVMISLCYAQQPCYLQHIVFPSLGLLQHYTEFDVCTIAMLEKLLGLGSFGTAMGHLALLGHYFYFFNGVRPSFSGPT